MKKQLKAFSLVILIFVLIISSFAGCGSQAGQTQESSQRSSAASSGSQASAAENATLNFVWFTDGIEGKVMQSVAEDYQKLNSNVTVKLIEVPFKDLNTKLKTMISGGMPPELARVTDTGYYFIMLWT